MPGRWFFLTSVPVLHASTSLSLSLSQLEAPARAAGRRQADLAKNQSKNAQSPVLRPFHDVGERRTTPGGFGVDWRMTMRIIVFPGRQGAPEPAKAPAPLAEVVAL